MIELGSNARSIIKQTTKVNQGELAFNKVAVSLQNLDDTANGQGFDFTPIETEPIVTASPGNLLAYMPCLGPVHARRTVRFGWFSFEIVIAKNVTLRVLSCEVGGYGARWNADPCTPSRTENASLCKTPSVGPQRQMRDGDATFAYLAQTYIHDEPADFIRGWQRRASYACGERAREAPC